jgi:hypothetical protein
MSEPTVVLLVGGTKPVRTALAASLPALHDAGAVVEAALFRPAPTEVADLGIREVRTLKASYFPSGVRRGHPRWAIGVVRRLFARVIGRYGDLAWKVWTVARRDPWLRAHAPAADVFVALDQAAVWTVWQLARRHPRATAVFGLQAAVDAVCAGQGPIVRQGRPRKAAT